MQWLDDLASDTAYYTKLGLYNIGLRSTPPIVQPVASVKGAADIKQQTDALEKQYSFGNQLKNSFDSITDWLKGKIFLLVIVAAILFFLYVYLKTKATKIAG